MLFVHNHESELGKGQKYGRPRADDDERFGRGKKPAPYLDAFVVGKFRMVDYHLVAENALQAFGQLGRKCNFRHEKQGLIALSENVVDEVEVNLGLSRAGHAVEERHGHGKPVFVQSLFPVDVTRI